MKLDLEKLAVAVGGVVVSSKATDLESTALNKLGFTFVQYGNNKLRQYFRMELAHVKLYVVIHHTIEGSSLPALYGYAIANEYDRQACDDYTYRFMHGLPDIKAIVKHLKNIDAVTSK